MDLPKALNFYSINNNAKRVPRSGRREESYYQPSSRVKGLFRPHTQAQVYQEELRRGLLQSKMDSNAYPLPLPIHFNVTE